MKPLPLFVLAATLGCAALPAAAADAKSPAKTIAPYVDDGTIAVARVDLTKVDLAKVFKAIPQLIPAPKEALAEGEKKLAKFVAALRAQKVTEIFGVLSLNDVPQNPPFLIIPVGAGGDHKKVAELMDFNRVQPAPGRGVQVRRATPFEVCAQLGDVVFCGRQTTLTRLKAGKPSPRKHLPAAFAAVSDAAIQVAVVPSKDHHRVISEMMSRLPKELGGLSGTELAKAVRFKAIGIQLPPKLKATVIVESNDAAGAKKLKTAYSSIAKSLGEVKELKRMGIDVPRLAGMLNPTIRGNRFQLSFDGDSKAGKSVLALFGGAVGQARKAARRTQSKNNLKQLGIAMHNFHDVYKSFPPVASFKKKKRLLSWRVYVLPFVEGHELFKQFHLNEPWDSPHNKKLIARMPRVFADPSGKLKKAGMTRYMAVVGKNHIFDGQPEGLPIRGITDGTSNTIMLVEAAPDSAVVWTKPDDLEFDAKNPFKGLVGKDAKGFLAAYADGSVRFLAKTLKPKTLKALFTRNGGEVVDFD